MKKLYTFSFLLVLLFAPAATSAQNGAYGIFKEGLELERQLRIFSAKDRFEEAIAMDAGNSGYLAHYGWFLHYHGFPEEAVIVFEKLLPLADDKKPVYAGLAWNLRTIGRPEASLAAYEKIFPVSAADRSIRKAFAEIDMLLYKENREKIGILKRKISESSDSIQLRRELFDVYISQGEFDNAISTAEDIKSAGEADRTDRLKLARVLYWDGRTRRAEDEYREIIAGSPESAFLYYELAKLLDDDGRPVEAREALEKSLELYPGAAPTRKRLAEVLAKLGKGDDAVRTAYSINPERGARLTGLMARARAFHFSGRLEEARPVYRSVLDEYPYNTDALWGLTETSIYTGGYAGARKALARWEKVPHDSRLAEQKRLFSLYYAPDVHLQSEYYTNSSDYTRVDLGASSGFYAGADTRVNAGYLFSGFSQDGFNDVSRQSVFIEAEKQAAERVLLGGRISANIYDNDNNTNLNGRLSLQVRPAEKLTAELGYRHFDVIDTVMPFQNPIYSHVVTIGAVGLDIRSDDYRFYLLYTPVPRVSLSGELIHGEYSDGNRKRSVLLEGGYQALYTPYLRLAYNYFYLDFRDPAEMFTEGAQSETAYWDPINFESHTLRLTFRDDSGRHLSYGAEPAVSYVPKSGGFAASASLFAAYTFSEHTSLRFDARWFYQDKSIDRQGETGSFHAGNYHITFRYRF